MTARPWWWLARVPAAALQLLLQAVAWTLSPWRLGRMLRTVSLPRMREHALRTNLTILGVALGAGVLVAIMLASRSIVLGLTATVDQLAGKADLQVQGGSSGFDEELVEKVRAVPGVYKVAPVMRQIVAARGANGRRERLLLLGVDMLGTEDSYFRDYPSEQLGAIRRDPLAFMNSTTNVILSRSIADRLGVKLHGEFEIATASGMERFHVRGLLDDEGIAAAFGGAVGIMYLPALQVAFDRGRNVDSVDVAVRPGTDAQPVARALSAAFGDGFQITPPTMRGERIARMLRTVRAALLVSSLIALAAGTLLVFNTVTISISQRERELGILRALGTTRSDLMALLTLEGTLLGSVGAAVGTAGGVYISRTLLDLTARVVDETALQVAVSKVRVDASLIAAGVFVGVAGATVAARLAAQRASAIQPAEALRSKVDRHAGVTRPRARSERLGLVLLALVLALLQLPTIDGFPVAAHAAGVTLILAVQCFMPWLVRAAHRGLAVLGRASFGVEATLATDNLRRELGRTAGAASGLMLAVGLTIGLATFTTSLMSSLSAWTRQSLPGQLFVTSGAAAVSLSAKNTPMSGALQAELLAIPGVEAVRPIRLADGDFRGQPIKVASTDFELFNRSTRLTLLEGEHDQLAAALERGAVVVSENFSRHFGVTKGAIIGLSAKDGTRQFEVAGVMVDYTSEVGTVWLERATYIAHFADPRVDTYELHLRREADAQAVRHAINARLSERFDLFVLTNAEFRGEVTRALDGVTSLMNVLELVTLMVAVLGLLTAVFANVLDRVREIGVLRALGMLRVQVRKIVTIEATLTGAIGLLGGLMAGAGMGYILVKHTMVVQMGWYLPYQVPWHSLATVALVTLPVSAIAGLIPARAAGRLIVSRALEYE